MSGGGWLQGAGETNERALFARRTRALPVPETPSLEAILAAADAPARPELSRSAAVRAGAFAAVALCAAACVGALLLVSARVAGERRVSWRASGESDAAAPASAWTPAGAEARGAGAVCEPSGDDEDLFSACDAPLASFAVASCDDGRPACVEPERPMQAASAVDGILACERAAMSCP